MTEAKPSIKRVARHRVRVAALMVGAASLALLALSPSADTVLSPARPALAAESQAVQAPIAGAPISFSGIVERVSPAVVSVIVRGGDASDTPVARRGRPEALPFPDLPESHPFNRFFREFGDRFGEPTPRQPRRFGTSQGSGFFISPDGYLVTNNHVVDDAGAVTVRLDDGTELDARVVGTDPRTDLALLKIDADRTFPHVAFADSEAKVGDWVIAVGNPFGLGGTVTAGIVSARGRDIGAGPYDDFIQIDAPVNRGNSGGPAFDVYGNVIGVNTAIFSPSGGNVGIAFAIPSATVEDVIAELRDNGTVSRGWLGVQIQPVTPEIAESLGLPTAEGAIIASLLDSGPAGPAGLERGDVVRTVDGDVINDGRALARKIGTLEPGHRARLEIWRDGASREISVTLGTQPAPDQLAAANPAPETEQTPEGLGLAVAGSPDGRGVAVLDVDPAGEGAAKGIASGDIILEVNGVAVNSPDALARAVSEARDSGRKAVLMLVKSDRGERFVALELGQARG